jgi:hypothetical protein
MSKLPTLMIGYHANSDTFILQLLRMSSSTYETCMAAMLALLHKLGSPRVDDISSSIYQTTGVLKTVTGNISHLSEL